MWICELGETQICERKHSNGGDGKLHSELLDSLLKEGGEFKEWLITWQGSLGGFSLGKEPHEIEPWC